MAAESSERIGILVIRAWIDGGQSAPRIRLTRTLDVSDRRGEESILTVSTDEACEIVREWLEGFARR